MEKYKIVGSIKKYAVDEARKMLKTPVGDTPKLAHDFFIYLIPRLGLTEDVWIIAYATYCQIVLNMECEEEQYKLIEPDYLKWWADRGYYFNVCTDKVLNLKLNYIRWWVDNGFYLN